MSWLSSILGSVASFGQQALQNRYNSREAQKNRDFQSLEASAQRDWSAQEAERARDWNEEMYEKYNSLSGKIAQAEQSGVNPMLAITGNAVTPAPASASAPSGASAGSVGNPTSSFVDLIGNILGLSKLKSEIALTQSQTEKNKAETAGTLINNETLRDMNVSEILSRMSDIEMNDANVSLISSKILNTDADTQVKGAQLGQIASQIANTDADTSVKEKQVAVMMSEILKNTKSLDVMDAQIAEMASVAGLNRSKAGEIAQNIRNMVQEYGHNMVMNGFEAISAGREVGADNWYNREFLPPIKRTIDSILGWFSGGVSLSKVAK